MTKTITFNELRDIKDRLCLLIRNIFLLFVILDGKGSNLLHIYSFSVKKPMLIFVFIDSYRKIPLYCCGIFSPTPCGEYSARRPC